MCSGNCWCLMRETKKFCEKMENAIAAAVGRPWEFTSAVVKRKHLPVILEYILWRIDNIRVFEVLMCCQSFAFHLCELRFFFSFPVFFSGYANTASEGTHSSWQHDQQWHYYVLHNGKCGLFRRFKKHFIFLIKMGELFLQLHFYVFLILVLQEIVLLNWV